MLEKHAEPGVDQPLFGCVDWRSTSFVDFCFVRHVPFFGLAKAGLAI
jgi:hypothetical protein